MQYILALPAEADWTEFFSCSQAAQSLLTESFTRTKLGAAQLWRNQNAAASFGLQAARAGLESRAEAGRATRTNTR